MNRPVETMNRINDTKMRLVVVAGELMRERSYGAVGVDAICRQARVNKGSFYYFFPTKADLAVAVIEHTWEGIRANVLEPAFRPDVPPLDRLARFFRTSYERQRQNKARLGYVPGCLFGSLGCELSSQDEKIRRKIAEVMGRVQNSFATVLAAARDAGQIAGDNLPGKVRALVAYLEGMQLQAKINNDPEILRELIPHLFELIGAKPSRTASARREASATSMASYEQRA